MNTLVIWILVPMILGFLLLLLPQRKTAVVVVGVITVVVLAFAALRLPVEGSFGFGSWRFSIQDHVNLAGFQFVLSGTRRPLIFILFGTTAFIMGGAIPARVHHRFVPLGLITIALIVGATSTEPILYGIFFFLLVVLFCVVILASPGREISKGVMRYLVFQIVGLAFILLSAGTLSDPAAILNDLPTMVPAILLLGTGFVILFAVFPLYTWVISIAEDAHPYAAMFVFSMTFSSYIFYFLNFLNNYGWLLGVFDIFSILRLIGVLMVATGGALAIFQRGMGRLFGYAVVIEMGHALLSIGIQNGELHYAMLIPRLVALAVWALGLSIFRQHVQDLRFKSVQGMARQYPFASLAVLFAHFSVAGLPITAGFPVLLALWRQLATTHLLQAVWVFLGSIGLLAGGFRTLAVLLMGGDQITWESKEEPSQRIYLILGMVAILLLGIYPYWLPPYFADLISTFTFFNP